MLHSNLSPSDPGRLLHIIIGIFVPSSSTNQSNTGLVFPTFFKADGTMSLMLSKVVGA
jgi:hypothetical protein